MNNRRLIQLIATLCALGTAWLAEATELKHMLDPNLDQFMVEISAHRDSGEAALLQRIEDIEANNGAFAPELYGYLSELAQLKQANNKHLEAIDLFQRMQTLTHWADGVDSPLQLEALKLQSRSRIARGEFVEADKLERFHYWVSKRHYDDEALIPAQWRMADWQRTTMQYQKAIKQYDETLELVNSHELASVYEVRTLEAKALTEYLAKSCCAVNSLDTALERRMASDFSDTLAIQAAKLNLADMQSLYNKEEAQQHYAELGNVPAALLGPRSQNDYLLALNGADNPIMRHSHVEVHYPKRTQTVSLGPKKPKPLTASIGEPVRLCSANVNTSGHVDVSMTITPNGKPQDLTINGDVPLQAKRYLRAVLLESRYRPEYKDGEAVAQNLSFRQYFDRTRPLHTDQVEGWRNILAEHACQVVAMR